MHLGFALSPQTDIIYDTIEFWLLIGGGVWGAFKSYQWVKAIREKDLKGLKTDVTTLNADLNRQTQSIESGFTSLEDATTRALQELRSDFRTFYISPDPRMVPVRTRTMRKKKSTTVKARVKSPVKKKTK